MNSVLRFALVATVASAVHAADRPWQQITNPTAAEVAKNLASPPAEYGATVTWGWDGPVTKEAVIRDLDTLHARGLRVATVEAGYRMDNAPYLSDEWFAMIRFTAEEARKRGMKLWIIDEGKYPSGFANGKFSQERPELRMQGVAIAERIDAAPGATVTRDLAAEVLGVIAVNTETGDNQSVDVSSRKLSFTAPTAGKWQLLVVDRQFRTGETRAVSDPTGAKTTKAHMGDLISAAAVKQWIDWTHEGYKKHMSDLFGTVILGFRGDEPDFSYTPWTNDIVAEFQRRKGYDPTPYLPYVASFPRNVALKLTDQQRRAKADYWDVWSDMFAQNFFKQQADWCAANGVEHTTHLNNDHSLPGLVRTTGDLFRAMRHVQVPGVDVIWSQIYPGRDVADFPKFASSVAHLNGRPRSLSESFAAYRDPLTVEVARWGVDYQLVRGINHFEFMFFRSSAQRPPPVAAAAAPAGVAPAPTPARGGAAGTPGGYMADPQFPALAAYTNRAQYVLAQGRPAAQIGVYCPTPSLWLGDNDANASMLKIAQQLHEAQRDFDFVDEQALSADLKLAGGGFTNLSGQTYRAIVVPSVTAMSKAALDRLQTFARQGGKVFFLGREPAMIVEKSFLHAKEGADLAWATLRESSGDVTPAVLAALPAPDVAFDQPCGPVKYTHRRLRDADVYFFFNESDQPQARQATLAGSGPVETWNLQTGQVGPLAGAQNTGAVTKIALSLGRYETKLVVIRGAPAVAMNR